MGGADRGIKGSVSSQDLEYPAPLRCLTTSLNCGYAEISF